MSVIASGLTDKDRKTQKPDLDSHSLIRFLDKFVYKNPKTAETARGVSIMQPLKATKDLGDIWLGSRAAGSGPTSVNSAAFWNKKSEDVAAEDAFFHTYFQHAAKEHKKPAKAAAGEGEDEDEDEIWKALVSSRPDVDGDDDSEGFDDLDEDEMASDDDEEPDMSLDGDSDEDMVDIEGSDEEEELEEEESEAGSDGLVAVEEEDDEPKSKKDEEKERRKSRRKEMKALPMFASTDDYAELLAQEEDGIF